MCHTIIKKNTSVSQGKYVKKATAFLSVVFLLIVATPVVIAQSNEIIDQLLEEQQATLGKSAYLVLLAADLISENSTPVESVEALASFDWGFDNATPEDAVDLGSLAFMIMKSFDMKGGIMYTIFPGRRYAVKEFAFRTLTLESASQYRILSGIDVANILGRSLDILGRRDGF